MIAIRRTLVALACYFALVHAMVVAWATVHPLAMQAAGSDAAFVICYGDPDGAKGGAVKLSCAICAAAATLAGTDAAPFEIDYAPVAGRADHSEASSLVSSVFAPRSGLSRTPPLVA